MFKVRIEEKGLHQMQARINKLKDIGEMAGHTALKDLARDLGMSVQEEIMNPSIGQYTFNWRGDLHDSIRIAEVSKTEVHIQEDSKGKWVRYGRKPKAGKPPRKLVEWVETKLGKFGSEGYMTARKIHNAGTLADSRAHWPESAKGYNYPEYVVNVKERGTIERYADTIGNVLVRYIATGNQR